jgi:hypothetical protein
MFGFMCNGSAYWQRPDMSIIMIKDENNLPDEVISDLKDVMDDIEKQLGD